MEFSNKYILGFALAVCLVCSLAVSSLAVALDERIDANKRLDQQLNILRVAGMIGADEKPSREEADALFGEGGVIETLIVSRTSGEVLEKPDFVGIDSMYRNSKAADTSTTTAELLEGTPAAADARKTQIARLPDQLVIYHVTAPGKECYVLPFWGNGLWSTMKGFLAVESDLTTVKGLTYAEHGETPGLGGEVDNPNWKAQWPGKLLWGEDGAVDIDVVKAGTVKRPEHQVDGISGATITSVAVGASLRVWLGEYGYGSWFDRTAPEGTR